MAKVDEFYGYTPDDIDPEFKKKNEDILNRPRGNGYWLWKPYFLYRTLEEKLDYGDFLIYSDAGILYMDAAQKLVDFLNKKNTDMYLHRLPHLERQYTKRTAFILLGVDDPFYAETGQFNAAFQIYRKTKFTEYFLKEYLYYAQDKRIITDDSNEMGEENYHEFKDHRHDQSILSLLIKKILASFRHEDLKEITQMNYFMFKRMGDIYTQDEIKHDEESEQKNFDMIEFLQFNDEIDKDVSNKINILSFIESNIGSIVSLIFSNPFLIVNILSWFLSS